MLPIALPRSECNLDPNSKNALKRDEDGGLAPANTPKLHLAKGPMTVCLTRHITLLFPQSPWFLTPCSLFSSTKDSGSLLTTFLPTSTAVLTFNKVGICEEDTPGPAVP